MDAAQHEQQKDLFGGWHVQLPSSQPAQSPLLPDAIPADDSEGQGQLFEEEEPTVSRFASGAGSPSIFEGYASAGARICVEVHGLSENMLTRVEAYLSRGGRVLLDSGAFVHRENPSRIRWPKVLARYAQLGTYPGAECVLPDQVGSQTATLGLLRIYADPLLKLRSKGLRFLQPIQSGPLPANEFWAACSAQLGFHPNGLAIPSNAAAFTLDDMASLRHIPEPPQRVHFLGIGRRSHALATRAHRIRHIWPDADITSDACEHRSLVGQGRPLTVLRRSYVQDITQQMIDRYDDTEDDHLAELALDEVLATHGVRPDELEPDQLDDMLCSMEAAFAQARLYQTRVIDPIAGPEATTRAIRDYAVTSGLGAGHSL